ncbi:MAG TPA: Hsp20/alpha crystallin family protein [Steroidobacteraceae bacterium]|jgi:HSP20 family molecular chaperone IbpA
MATSTAEVTQQLHKAQAPERVLRPLVDIYEDADGITLHADVPGVSKERLNVHVDGNTLALEGKTEDTGSAPTLYRRTFALSRELATDAIEAKVKDGVLTVRIPKKAEDRPRKIAIQ